MNYFIKNIKVNELFHLHNFSISILNENTPHLLLTGKNGTGKTILLNAIAEFLEMVRTDKNLDYLKTAKHAENYCERALNAKNEADRLNYQNLSQYWKKKYDEQFGKVDIEFNDIYETAELIRKNEFVFAFYRANRKPDISEPKNPTKPNLKQNNKVTETVTNQFLYFLSDLKIQEALARNEGQIRDADDIRKWFNEFETILREMFEDKVLTLTFNYKDYTFKINSKGKSFKFTEMSDGFSAALDIIADLILKMQDEKSLSRVYDKQGVVLIDEIETHLHLELQRLILPLLTKVFPNIQFIVTTHSPFVLNSVNNAVAYDLERKEIINDLTDYSYEALAEGYFGVRTDSSYIQMRLATLRNLLQKNDITVNDKEQLSALISDFSKIPEAVAPLVVGEFLQLKVQYSEKINAIKS